MPEGFKGYIETMMLEGRQGQSFTVFLKTKAFRRVWVHLASSFQVRFDI